MGTENVQVTRARGGPTTTTSYCPLNPLDRGLWVHMAGGGRAREEAWSWVPWSLSSLVGSVFSPPPRPPQKSQKLLTRDPGEGQASKTQNGRLQQHTARLTQKEPAVAVATGTEQASRKAKEFKDLAATHSVGSGSHAESQR